MSGMDEDDQSYYWTEEWQQAARESREAYERGEYVEFTNDLDIERWLNDAASR